MNSNDPLLKISSTLGKVEANVETIMKTLEKHDLHTNERFHDLDERVSALESRWGKLIAIASAAALLVTVIWNIGGDYIKSSVQPSPAALSISVGKSGR